MNAKIFTRLVLLPLLFFFNFSIAQVTIESTTDGGNWSDPATWTGGSVPTSIDNVVLKGPVYLDQNATCDDLNIQTGGELRNTGAQRILDISGNVVNNGLIDDISYILTLNINGNLENHGAWQNGETNLVGAFPQEIKTYVDFEGVNLTINKPSGHISSSIPLRFNSANVDFNDDTLYMTSGLDSIFLFNGLISNGTIICPNSPGELYFRQNTNSDYVSNIIIVADELVIDGFFIFSSPFEIYGNVRVEGSLSNKLISNQVMSVYGDFINNEALFDQLYGWRLYITGNIVNHGNWTNYYTYLSGDGDQNLNFVLPFEGEQLLKSNPSGLVIAQSNLSFVNTIIDLDYDTLVFSEGFDSLKVSGGYIKETVITMQVNNTKGSLKIYQDNDAYFQYVEIVNNVIDLSGTFQFRTPMIFNGNVEVNGILQNDNTSTHIANINGNLINNGIIQDIYNICRLHITGDIYQNGQWLNNITWLLGEEDQAIHLINNSQMENMTAFDALEAGTPYQWYYNGGILSSPDFEGETGNLLTWNVPVSSSWYGEFYCETGAGPSRTITVEGGSLIDITAMLEGPFNGSTMNTTLNTAGIIPLSQPFSGPPWDYPGTETVANIPPDVVDWILLEYRDAADINSATFEATIGKQAAFIRNDGQIVNLNGSAPPLFNLTLNDNLFVVIWHRNHLPVLSANPLIETAGVYSYDFTISAEQAYEGNQNDLGSGAFGMISGDLNADGIIDEFDLSTQWNIEAGAFGYFSGDVNLDAQVDNQDKDEFWINNIGKTEQFPDVGFINCGDNLPDDRDGQIYSTVQIGDQCWMAENLNIGTMINGTSTPSNNGVIEKYCFNNSIANCESNGAFYLWNELMEYSTVEGSQGVCPEGWHIPSHSEWCTMEQHLDPTVICDNTGFRGTNVGTQLKVGGASGFEALLSGQRQFNGSFDHLDFRGYFWSSTSSGSLATMRFVQSNDARSYYWNTDKIYGFNVRCVLDE
ncbi:MAG: hypothetical protein KQI35_05560 [Bacteroidetes bacterium]|nr:hypothetical protein [Bacteroidota bacterium]